MTRERLYCTEAVVLKRTDFGEADRLLTLYTPHLGKHRTIAKGVRKLISPEGRTSRAFHPHSTASGQRPLFRHRHAGGDNRRLSITANGPWSGPAARITWLSYWIASQKRG